MFSIFPNNKVLQIHQNYQGLWTANINSRNYYSVVIDLLPRIYKLKKNPVDIQH